MRRSSSGLPHAETEEVSTDKVATHSAQDPGVPEVTPELSATVKAAIPHQ